MRSNKSNNNHTNLFLLRVWCDALVENENGEKGEGSGLKWHGRLQRTVSGEARSFDGKDTLIEVLESMLYKERLEHAGPPGATGREPRSHATAMNRMRQTAKPVIAEGNEEDETWRDR